ncbi:BTB/POZ domain-containing protein NPY1-like [Panicum miliaceum]|uniref:BTB/POZ domain-containing protein NPY1-like n=1 Tax=Panicum miliaceum TaxID=4540 RepID=A0A3L6RYN8_PANMI|nr:BTB/POZ domain-containing protein NPY1-like [Panicum miliaceum]
MKFMKLGSKPDAFQDDGSDARYVLSDLPSDIVIHVDGARFYLHKFPLLSKSSVLQRLIIEASQNGTDEVVIQDIPGGVKTFEICAKFCYGMVVTLNAYNAVAARCAAEYLGMTEDVEKSNLIFKMEVFLNSGIFRSWKDSIIALQTTDALLPWSEELKLVGRCIDSIATKATVNPSNVMWSYTYNRKSASSDEIVEARKSSQAVPKDWWVEDLCELDVDLYRRVMVAVKSRGRIPSDVVGEALKAYAARWLPECCDTLVDDVYSESYKHLLETIVWLLPSDKGSSGISCRFFLRLLKVTVLIGAGELLKEELMDSIVLQLHKASVHDLLIPSKPPAQTIYDIQLVQTLIGRYMRHAGVAEDGIFLNNLDQEMFETSVDNESLVALCKLVDRYLAEVASDPNLSVSSFVDLATSMPESARTTHDGLYTAIDIFLKLHPGLPKTEKRKICSLMDVKKLSKGACIHAAQNDRLPLRVVVQVLFFEQLRAAGAASAGPGPNGSMARCMARLAEEEEEDDDWKDGRAQQEPPTPGALKKQLGSLKLAAADRGAGDDGRRLVARSSSVANQSSRLSLSSRSRRIFDKLWVGGAKLPGEGPAGGKGSSDTSGSSQSPRSSVKPLESKSSSSSSRNRRYSVS